MTNYLVKVKEYNKLWEAYGNYYSKKLADGVALTLGEHGLEVKILELKEIKNERSANKKSER